MTIRARAERDWMRDSVRIHVGEVNARGDLAHIFTWRDEVTVVDDPTSPIGLPDDSGLLLREDIARAVYEALAEHFGFTGHDGRALRKDYEAERARVDKFISHLTGVTR